MTKLDISFAEKLGYTIKLLGIVKKCDQPASPGRKLKAKSSIGINGCPIQVTVYPTLVPNAHVLASVNHVFNAILVRGDIVGDTLYYGRGAGQDATASAVLSDLADAALDLKLGTSSRIPPFVPHEREGAVLPIDDVVSRYYVRLSVADQPGTMAKIATILGRAKIGISSVIQPEGHAGRHRPVDSDDSRRNQCCDDESAGPDCQAAGRERDSGHDSRGKFRMNTLTAPKVQPQLATA